MKIVVFSCDACADTFEPFYKCMEKYYPNHPEIIYITETIKNPYYKTICKNYPLDLWTKKIREALKEIDDNVILLTTDDNFIRQPVDEERINYVASVIGGNIAMFNFEKSFDSQDQECEYKGFKKKNLKGIAVNSIMCGIWQKDKLIQALNITCQPWEIERLNIAVGEYYINSGDYIIDYGYIFQQPFGITKGKWAREVVPFFEKEGIVIDYEKRGFYEK
ncbi:hypothetical protein IKS57_04855 [bacterium]|nr:hypothetical protein [bacterium]